MITPPTISGRSLHGARDCPEGERLVGLRPAVNLEHSVGDHIATPPFSMIFHAFNMKARGQEAARLKHRPVSQSRCDNGAGLTKLHTNLSLFFQRPAARVKVAAGLICTDLTGVN